MKCLNRTLFCLVDKKNQGSTLPVTQLQGTQGRWICKQQKDIFRDWKAPPSVDYNSCSELLNKRSDFTKIKKNPIHTFRKSLKIANFFLCQLIGIETNKCNFFYD